jgi:hypothetical protein
MSKLPHEKQQQSGLSQFGAGVDPSEEASLCPNPDCDSNAWYNVGANGLRCENCDATIPNERLAAFDREGLL